MSLAHKCLAIVFALSLTLSKASASDVSFCQPDIPAGLWDQHTEGVAVAITLTKGLNAIQRPATLLKVYIKNTSEKAFAYGQNDDDLGIRFFYINSMGAKMPLHDYLTQEQLNSEIRQRTVQDIAVAPGKTLCVTLDNIAPEETSLLTSHPVFCSFPIGYPPNRRTIISTPKILAVP